MRLKQFDILLIKNRPGVLAKIVSHFTKTQYVHACLVLDQSHIIDTSFTQPVAIRHINRKLGEFDCYRLRLQLSPGQTDKMIEFLQKNLNSRYSLREALSYIGVSRWARSYKREPHRFTCISLVLEALKAAGVPVKNETGVNSFVYIRGSKLFERVTGGDGE